MKVKIYVEGGGEGTSLPAECRKAFSKFFEKRLRKHDRKRNLPKVIPSGSRNEAFERFCAELSVAKNDEFVILLVDSEDLLETDPQTHAPAKPWLHLLRRDGWKRPPAATDENAHLMVVVMESWFLADPSALKEYFDPGFKIEKLKKHPHIERVPKSTVFQELRDATVETKTKGSYDKSRHSFNIVAVIDPEKVSKECPHAKRLFETLESML